MASNCFQDSCGVTWSEVVDELSGPQYRADLRIDGDSSLFCDLPSGGLNVKILPPDLDGGNLLQRDGSGNLYVSLQGAVRVVRDDEATTGAGAVPMKGIGAVYDDEGDSADSFSGSAAFSIVNPFVGTALAIVTAEMQFGWSVNPAGPKISPSSGPDLTLFNGQFVYRLRAGGDLVCQERLSISGVTDTNGDTGQHKKDYRGLTFTRVIPQGGSVALSDACWNEGPDQRISMITSASQAAPVRGFRTSRVRALLIPLPGA